MTMRELIKEATAMLMDKPHLERELIYYMAKMPEEERAAIVIAYQLLREER